jgi:MFS family permease
MGGEGLRAVSRESKLVIALVSGSEFVNHTYIVLLPPILGLLSGEFDASLGLLGLAVGARAAATAAFQLPFGYLSDRHDRLLGLGLSLGLGSLGALVTALAPSLPVLVAGQVIVGVGVAGHHPSHFPILSETVAEEYRGRVFSVRGFAGSLGFATPPVVATAVLAMPGTTWRHVVGVLALLGGAYAVVALALFRLFVDREVTLPDPTAIPDRDPGASLAGRVGAELRSIVDSPAVLALGALTFVTAVYSSGFRTYVVVHLTEGYGLSLGLANLTLTATFVGGALLMLGGGALSDRFPAGTLLVAAYAAIALLTALVASLAVPAVLAMGLAIATGGFRAGSGPPRSKLVDRFADSGALGQSFAVITVGMMLGGTVAPPLFGYLIETAGLRWAFYAMAAVMVAAVAFAVGILRTYDDAFSLPRPIGAQER